MAKTRQQKEKIQENLNKKIGNVESVVFVGFNALSVADSTLMRRVLRKSGVGFSVAKKTLLKRVLADNEIKGQIPELSGEIAIAYGQDSVLPAKSIFDFQAKFDKGRLSILGGVLDGAYLSASETISLAKIPSREILYGQLVNVINGPIQGLVSTLGAVTRNFVIALDQIAKSKN